MKGGPVIQYSSHGKKLNIHADSTKPLWTATRLPLWGLTALGTRGRGPRSGRAWSSQGLLVAIHTWSSSGAARKLQTTNYLAKIRVGKITTLKMVKQLSLSDLQVEPNYLLFNIGKLFSGLDILCRPEKKCRCPACPPYDTFWTRPSGTYQR